MRISLHFRIEMTRILRISSFTSLCQVLGVKWRNVRWKNQYLWTEMNDVQSERVYCSYCSVTETKGICDVVSCYYYWLLHMHRFAYRVLLLPTARHKRENHDNHFNIIDDDHKDGGWREWDSVVSNVDESETKKDYASFVFISVDEARMLMTCGTRYGCIEMFNPICWLVRPPKTIERIHTTKRVPPNWCREFAKQ